MNLFSGLIVLVVLSTDIAEVHTNLSRREYAQLISDVHNFYDTSSVLIIHNNKLENFWEIGAIFEIVEWLSSLGIPSQTTVIKQLSKVQSYYVKRVKRQLYVVLVRRNETIREFENVMRNVIVSGPVWLIIFPPLDGEQILIDYCTNPRGNPFHLAFNTELLVKCYNEEILREWYSIYENETTIFDLFTWDPVNRLKLLNENSLYVRRNHIGGVSMKVVTVNGSMLVEERFGALGGFFGDVLWELSHSINFKIKHIHKENEYGIRNEITKEWSGVMKQLCNKKADFGAADMVISKQRLNYVDFTIPLITTRIVLCIKKPVIEGVQHLGYLQALDSYIWSSLILLVLITPILLTLIKLKSNNKEPKNWKTLLCENYLDVWGIYCQQGLSEFPTLTSYRLAYFSIFISAFIVSSAYSAELISFLTVPETTLPFTTLQGFVNNGQYKLIVLKNSVHHETFNKTKDQLLKGMKKFLKAESELPETILDALIQICNSKTAFYTTEDSLISWNPPTNCKLTWIQTGEITCLAMPLTKGNQYNGIINFNLNRFLDNGMLNYLNKRRRDMKNGHFKTEYHVVTISGVTPILKIVIVGLVLSVLLFIAEKTYSVYTKNSNRVRKMLREFSSQDIIINFSSNKK